MHIHGELMNELTKLMKSIILHQLHLSERLFNFQIDVSLQSIAVELSLTLVANY